MKRTSIILMLITFFSKILGLMRDVVLSNYYGITYITDAYLISISISAVVFGAIFTGISTGYIPLYKEVEKNKSTEHADLFTSNLINITLIFGTIVIFISYVFMDKIIMLFALGFDNQTREIAINFARIGILDIYFTGIIFILSGYLQIKGKFIVPVLIGFPLNIITIISIIISDITSIYALAIGTLIATFSQVLLLVPFAVKNKYRHSFHLNLSDQYIKKIGLLAIPIIIGISINQINLIIDRSLASIIMVGGVASLNYASRLTSFVQGIFVLSISAVIFPLITKNVIEKNIDSLKKTLQDSIILLLILLIPSTTGLIVMAKPLISLLYGRGEFDFEAINITSKILVFYSLGILGIGLREIFSKVLYSYQDTKIVMKNAVIAVTVNIVLNLILSYFMGIIGLAIATSISSILSAYLLFNSVVKKIGHINVKEIFTIFLKVFFSSLVMGICVVIIFKLSEAVFAEWITCLISITTGLIIYFIFLLILKVKEVQDLFYKIFKNKFKKIFLH